MKTQCLPTERDLISLVRATAFPATRDEVIATAKHQRCSRSTIDFMRIFDPADRFENGVDFINRCEEVGLCISEESNAPSEQLRSP